jgi:hypothetical protein
MKKYRITTEIVSNPPNHMYFGLRAGDNFSAADFRSWAQIRKMSARTEQRIERQLAGLVEGQLLLIDVER